MSSMTPFFSITASSSFFTSSKVKPYWKPEQPPPVTNTRSLSSGLPSSSISCLTLFAALSLNTSGEGISVTAFISSLLDPFQLIRPRRASSRLPSAPSEAHAECRAGLVGPHLVHAYLNALHLRLRAHPEGPLDPPEVLECQPKGGRAGVPRLGKAHDSTLPPFRQVYQQLQPAVEITALPGGRRQEQQPVAVLPGQDIGLHLEPVDRQGIGAARLGRQHALESRQFFPHPGIFLLQRADLLGELLLGGALDGQAVVGGIRDSAKAVQLGARVLERTARRAQLFLHFAAVEAGKAPPGVVDPCGRGRRDAEQHGDADPAPVPGDLALNGDARRSDAEALAELPHSRDQLAQ